jgi:hypothetical protein
MWDIRLALSEYLELATREGFETRRRLLRYLRQHSEGGRLCDWLIEVDVATWHSEQDALAQAA